LKRLVVFDESERTCRGHADDPLTTRVRVGSAAPRRTRV
jgi:hypothetical protein